MIFNSLLDLGQIVFLKTDEDQRARMITKLSYSVGDTKPLYYLACGSSESAHYEAEISTEKNIQVAMGIEAIEETI
jgi:hypothetical protein